MKKAIIIMVIVTMSLTLLAVGVKKALSMKDYINKKYIKGAVTILKEVMAKDDAKIYGWNDELYKVNRTSEFSSTGYVDFFKYSRYFGLINQVIGEGMRQSSMDHGTCRWEDGGYRNLELQHVKKVVLGIHASPIDKYDLPKSNKVVNSLLLKTAYNLAKKDILAELKAQKAVEEAIEMTQVLIKNLDGDFPADFWGKRQKIIDKIIVAEKSYYAGKNRDYIDNTQKVKFDKIAKTREKRIDGFYKELKNFDKNQKFSMSDCNFTGKYPEVADVAIPLLKDFLKELYKISPRG